MVFECDEVKLSLVGKWERGSTYWLPLFVAILFTFYFDLLCVSIQKLIPTGLKGKIEGSGICVIRIFLAGF